MPDLARHVWPDRIDLARDGALALDGIPLDELARRFGTPLYVYDAATVRASLAAYRRAFAAWSPSRVGYSLKACALLGVLALVRTVPASAASLGELEAAAAAGMDPRRAWLHGNAKREDELRGAMALRVGRVVIDGEAEVERLERLARRPQAVWLRVAPDVAADTHAHLATGARDQKFGLAPEVAIDLAPRIARSRRLRLVGLHAHVGSQIRDLDAFASASRALVALARELDAPLREVCVGGGLSAPQTRDEALPDLEAYAAAVSRPIREWSEEVTIVVEPGRSIVGRAAVALYRAVERKAVPGGRTFVSVDGGMGDNVRPALYGARYDATLVSRPEAPAAERVAIAGSYCEAGDVLIGDVALPRVAVGDLVAVPSVGAYSVAMASNYNHRPRPAVVLVDRGRATLIRRRERTADLLRTERVALARAGRAARGGRGSRGG